jgi:two-component sensor histidine kinase
VPHRCSPCSPEVSSPSGRSRPGSSGSRWPAASRCGRRLATRATLQRDLVVAASEAERARLAADIHDDALQELTLLVRRLEASGDTEGAEIGRTVADKLRAICGDLRLPILDDLGVGPALDWLVLRIERLAGGEVRLERADDARHAPEVELAIFRVAQEALANAVKHGQPPIVVRYRSTDGGISLSIDDAGPGIAEDAPDAAEQTGRFGLLNMAQRAEQIGAILDVRRWPGGGTHVALEWRDDGRIGGDPAADRRRPPGRREAPPRSWRPSLDLVAGTAGSIDERRRSSRLALSIRLGPIRPAAPAGGSDAGHPLASS